MANLLELQNFCENKSIIIVGNSSRILRHGKGRLIDGYDIVVRINRGYQPDNSFAESHGTPESIAFRRPPIVQPSRLEDKP